MLLIVVLVFSSYNTVCPRETPSWQKPITSFFLSKDKPTKENEGNNIQINDMIAYNKATNNDVTMAESNIISSSTDKENSNPRSSMVHEPNIICSFETQRKRYCDEDCWDATFSTKKRKLELSEYAFLEELEK